MKQAAHRSVFFLLFSFLLVPLLDASVTPVNPQPGENIWHITAGIGTELDQISQIVINNGNAAAACCSGTFTALQKVDNDILTVSSKLDACCATLSSKIDSIVCTSSGSTSATCDFSTIFTALQKVDNDVLTVSSKVDALTNIVNLDFNGTFTALNALSNLVTNDFNGTFTALNSCCSTLNSKLDVVNTFNFPQTNQFIALVDNDVAAVKDQLNTVQSQVSALSQVCSWTGPVSPTPVATLFWGNQLNTIAWNRIGNQVAIGGSTVSNPTNSIAVYGVSGSNMFPLAATGLNASSVTNSLDWSYDGQYIAAAVHREGINNYNAAIYNAQSLVQVANISTNILDGASIGWQPGDNFLALTDQGGNLNILSFDGIKTISVVTQTTPAGTGAAYLSWSPTGQYLAVVRGTTLSIYSYSGGNSVSLLQTSAVSAGSLNAVHWASNSLYIATGDSAGVARVHTYNAGTNTISTVASQTLTQQVRSVRWSAQANTLAVGIDQDATNKDLYVYAFVPNTLTLVSALQPQIGGSVFGLSWTPSLASCQQYLATAGSASGSNPNVAIYGSSITTTPALSLSGTFTALDACCRTLNSKLDRLAVSFNGTFTSLAALNNLIVNDFNGTFTSLNSLNKLIVNDFNGTFSVLAQGFACGATPLYQSNFSGGTLSLTSTGATYCFAQNLMGAIIVSGQEIDVDLAMHNLVGTFSVIGSDATIHNGNILPAAPSNIADVLTAGIYISSAASGALIKDCRVECTTTALSGVNGRDAIANAGSNTIITDCYINAGTGGPGNAGILGGTGGTGINNTGSNVLIKNSKIQLSDGGNTVFFLYAPQSGTTNLFPINLSNNSIGSAITVGNNASGIAITPNGTKAYVTNQDDNTVSPVTLATNTAGTPISVGTAPFGIAITPDGTKAYVTNQTSGTVTPITIATNTAGAPITVGTNPSGIAITPDGTKAYVANVLSNTVTPITIATNTAGAPIAVGTNPSGIAITPDGTTAYVTTRGDNTVTPITIATNTAGTPISVGTSPFGIAITPNGTTAYVANTGSNNVTPITIATNTAGTSISVGFSAFSVAITPDSTTAYVGGSGNITAITIATNTISSTIGVSGNLALAITPNNRGNGGGGILQQSNFGKIISTEVQGRTSNGTVGDGIAATANAQSNVIQECTVFNVGNGFKINGSSGFWINDCIAQACVTDGFVATGSATSIAVDHCTAMLNGSDGFDFSAAGACCSVGDSSAISNTVYGFMGTGTNVFFYNNFANCNGTNFDSASASSAISGKLDSKIDVLLQQANAVNFNGTFTALDACCRTLNSKLDRLAVSFNGTFTSLAALNNLIVNDFNGTFTALNSLNNLIVNDFNGTFTSINALGLCGSTPLSQSNVVNGQLVLSTPGASYCLSQNITGSIFVSAANVAIDLNEYTLQGNIIVNDSFSNCRIQNGIVSPPSPSSNLDATFAAIRIGAANNALVEDVYVLCANSTTTGVLAGRDGIRTFGANTIIQRCFIQSGTGNNGGITVAGGNGGVGISASGPGLQVIDCTILTGAGGNGGLTTIAATAAGSGGNSGAGIFSIAANTQITNCMIMTGGGGLGGSNTFTGATTNSNGGTGGTAGNGITCTGAQAQIADCSIIAGPGNAGGNSSASAQSFGGQGGAGGNGISITGATSTVTGCYIVGGAGSNSGVSASGFGTGGGNGGVGIVTGSQNGMSIQSCVIRMNGGGNAGLTLTNNSNVAQGGIGGDGILVQSGMVDSIIGCDIASATSLLNGGGISYATGARGGHGINVSGGQVNLIKDCTISSLGAGGVGNQTQANATNVIAGAGGNGIEIDAPVGAVRNCTINYTGNGGNATTAGGIGTGTITGGAGGIGIVVNAAVGVLENCVVYSTGAGGSATGSGVTTTATGGAGGTGISVSSSAGNMNILENCKVSSMGAGGNAASGNTNNGGAGGIGFYINKASMIMKNCQVCITGQGGTGASTTGAGGIGIQVDTNSSAVELIDCLVERTSTAGNGTFTGHAFQINGSNCLLENCFANTINGDGFRVLSSAGIINIRGCSATFCLANGYNMSTSGAGNVVEKCLASGCKQAGAFGFLSQNNSNTVFLLNEARNNTLNYDTANITAANGSFPPVSITVGGNYGANLMGNGNTN